MSNMPPPKQAPTPTTPPSYLDKLPTELFEIVTSNLDPVDLLALRSTSKARLFKSQETFSKVFFSELKLWLYDKFSLHEALQHIDHEQYGRVISKLTIYIDKWHRERDGEIAATCKGLERLAGKSTVVYQNSMTDRGKEANLEILGPILKELKRTAKLKEVCISWGSAPRTVSSELAAWTQEEINHRVRCVYFPPSEAEATEVLAIFEALSKCDISLESLQTGDSLDPEQNLRHNCEYGPRFDLLTNSTLDMGHFQNVIKNLTTFKFDFWQTTSTPEAARSVLSTIASTPKLKHLDLSFRFSFDTRSFDMSFDANEDTMEGSLDHSSSGTGFFDMVFPKLKTLNLLGIQSTVQELVAFVKRQPPLDHFRLRLSRLLEWPEENAVLKACVAVDDIEYDEEVLADLIGMDVDKVFVEEGVVDVWA